MNFFEVPFANTSLQFEQVRGFDGSGAFNTFFGGNDNGALSFLSLRLIQNLFTEDFFIKNLVEPQLTDLGQTNSVYTQSGYNFFDGKGYSLFVNMTQKMFFMPKNDVNAKLCGYLHEKFNVEIPSGTPSHNSYRPDVPTIIQYNDALTLLKNYRCVTCHANSLAGAPSIDFTTKAGIQRANTEIGQATGQGIIDAVAQRISDKDDDIRMPYLSGFGYVHDNDQKRILQYLDSMLH